MDCTETPDGTWSIYGSSLGSGLSAFHRGWNGNTDLYDMVLRVEKYDYRVALRGTSLCFLFCCCLYFCIAILILMIEEEGLCSFISLNMLHPNLSTPISTNIYGLSVFSTHNDSLLWEIIKKRMLRWQGIRVMGKMDGWTSMYLQWSEVDAVTKDNST